MKITSNDYEKVEKDYSELTSYKDNCLSNNIKCKKSNLCILLISLGPLNEDEDKLLIQLVQKNGPQKWTLIANQIPGRIGKQCREMYSNKKLKKIK